MTFTALAPFEGVQAIAIDGFNTFFRTGPFDQPKAIHQALQGAGFETDIDELARYYRSLESLDSLGYFFSTGSSGNFDADRWRMLVTWLGIEFTAELAQRLRHAEQACYAEGAEVFPGSPECIKHLDSIGVPTALCTNATETGWWLERKLGLSDYFNTTVVSRFEHLVKAPKGPRSSLFTRLPKELGFHSSQILVVDDEIRWLKIAKGLGFRTCLTTEGWDQDLGDIRYPHIDLIVPELVVLADYFE